MEELGLSKTDKGKKSGDYANYVIDENGFLKVTFNISFGDKISMLDAQGYISIVTQMTNGTPKPFLLNFLKFNNLISPKIISFLAKNDDLQSLSTAKAFVVVSSVYRAILKQYIKIVSKKYPMKVFKTEEEAVVWLKSVS